MPQTNPTLSTSASATLKAWRMTNLIKSPCQPQCQPQCKNSQDDTHKHHKHAMLNNVALGFKSNFLLEVTVEVKPQTPPFGKAFCSVSESFTCLIVMSAQWQTKAFSAETSASLVPGRWKLHKILQGDWASRESADSNLMLAFEHENKSSPLNHAQTTHLLLKHRNKQYSRRHSHFHTNQCRQEWLRLACLTRSQPTKSGCQHPR